jgi:hypothetical protein
VQGLSSLRSKGKHNEDVGDQHLSVCWSPTTLMWGGQMEQVILVLGQLALILAGVFCVVGFVLLIVSMVLTTVRKLLEFTRL